MASLVEDFHPLGSVGDHILDLKDNNLKVDQEDREDTLKVDQEDQEDREDTPKVFLSHQDFAVDHFQEVYHPQCLHQGSVEALSLVCQECSSVGDHFLHKDLHKGLHKGLHKVFHKGLHKDLKKRF